MVCLLEDVYTNNVLLVYHDSLKLLTVGVQYKFYIKLCIV